MRKSKPAPSAGLASATRPAVASPGAWEVAPSSVIREATPSVVSGETATAGGEDSENSRGRCFFGRFFANQPAFVSILSALISGRKKWSSLRFG